MAKSRRKKTRRKKRKAKGLTQQEKEKINSTLKNRNLKTISLSSKYHELPSELQKKIELEVKSYLQEKKKVKKPTSADRERLNNAIREAQEARNELSKVKQEKEEVNRRIEEIKNDPNLNKRQKARMIGKIQL